MTAPVPPKPPEPPKYLSHISQRKEVFKTHVNLGHVKTAMGNYMGARPGDQVSIDMWAWELKEGIYELLWHIAEGSLVDDLPWAKKLYKPYTPPHISCSCINCKG